MLYSDNESYIAEHVGELLKKLLTSCLVRNQHSFLILQHFSVARCFYNYVIHTVHFVSCLIVVVDHSVSLLV